MRFILAIADNFDPKDSSDYKLVNWIDTGIDIDFSINFSISVSIINDFLKKVKTEKIIDTWDLPPIDVYDVGLLERIGYLIIRRVNRKAFDNKRVVVIFDIQNHNNIKLKGFLREEKLNKLIDE